MNSLDKFILLIITFVIILGCGDEPKKETNKAVIPSASEPQANMNLNISFLLDLSDRIDPEKYPNETMDFYMRDAAYIKSVAEGFYNHLRAKKVRQFNDKIQVYFDPEPNNPNINKISGDLRYHVTRDNATMELLDDIKGKYASIPIQIYEAAIDDDHYVGSDTWGFFKSKIKDYCIEEGYRNILIILTDGYIYHQNNKIEEGNRTSYLTPQDIRINKKFNASNWKERFLDEGYGFIPATENLENVEILVLGINPDIKNPYEEDVIMEYWKDWFNLMGIEKYAIKTADLPANLDKIIKSFINDN